METNKENKNEFIREQIKDKPKNKKKILEKIGISALCGLVFALTAVAVFLILGPLVQKRTGISKGTETSENAASMQTESETESETGTELALETEAQEETQTTGSFDTESTQEAVPPDDWELTIEHYQAVQNELYAIGNEQNKSIVTVTGVVSNTDWFNNSYENEGQGSGVIIGENVSDLFILTERKVIADAERISVTFIDDTVADAELRKYDANTGIAVLSVSKKSLNTSTMSRIAIAKIDNSVAVTNGMMVLALGSPLGTNYSILVGNITSRNNEITTYDHNYSIFTTDIVASKNGNGILINVDGEVVGVVRQEYSSAKEENTLTAVSIRDLKPTIDMLMEGKDIPYIGLMVSQVTEKIAKQYELPKGVYIKDVQMDSPAMIGGLQIGDIITAINGEAVMSEAAYSTQILKQQVGTVVPITVQRQTADGYSEIKCQVEVGVLP